MLSEPLPSTPKFQTASHIRNREIGPEKPLQQSLTLSCSTAVLKSLRRLSVIISILPLSTSAATAQDTLPEQVKISPKPPAWVKPIEPKINGVLSKNAASDGAWYLLSNNQVHPEAAEYYEHYSLKFLSTEGVENNSDISVSIDPDYQTLDWNRLRILRDGEIIDLLPEQKFLVSENQSDRTNLIYDNTLEILAIVEGSQKGDVLDYAYTIRGRNPITADRSTYWFSMQFGVPVDRIYSRVVQPKDSQPYSMRYFADTDSESLAIPEPQEEGDYLITEFNRTDVPGILRDANTPSDFISHPYIQITNWQSWQQVAEWAAALYEWNEPNDPEIDLLIANLRAIANPHEAARIALNWVQEEIRYVGIMIGPHNYKPYPIPVTLERRFGDCKDKSQLLSYILREVGIDADPVLVNTSEQRLVARHMPTPMAFDHVITRIHIEGQDYFVDPTNWKQGGPLAEIYTPAYRSGLLLNESSDQLIEIPGQGFAKSTTQVTETYEMDDYGGTVSFKSISAYGGAEADYIRRYFERNSDDEINKDYTNFYAAQFPDIQSKRPPTIDDDWRANRIVTHERYQIENAWTRENGDDENQYFEVYPDILQDSISVSSTRLRTMPAEQTYPLDTTQTIEIILPEPGDFEPESHSIHNQWFEFDYSVVPGDEKLSISYRFRALGPEIAAEDYPNYAAALDEINDYLGYSIYNRLGTDSESTGTTRAYLPTSLAAGYSFTIGIGLALWLVTRRKRHRQPAQNPDLDGISGWLVLPAIGMMLIPFILIGHAVEMSPVFNYDTMFGLTEPGYPDFRNGYAALVIAEVSWQFFCIPVGFALAFCFFAKRSITPAFVISFVLIRNIVAIADIFAANSVINGSATSFDEGSLEGFTMAKDVVIAATWITYFLVSERVKSTFRH